MEDTLMIPRESLISQFNCKFVALGQVYTNLSQRADVVAYGFKGYIDGMSEDM
ncbi:MAG: hypothetical protein [Bacteriophage sp.]|nr:MAG: hypothetical protein [Bacteriophage sp.]